MFCRYNSGAPQKRDRVTRGPSLFTVSFVSAKDLAEVVFRDQVHVPPGIAEVCQGGRWVPA